MAKSRAQTQPVSQETHELTQMVDAVERIRNAVCVAATALDFLMAVDSQEEGFFESFFSVSIVTTTLNKSAVDLLERSFDDIQSIGEHIEALRPRCAVVQRGSNAS